MSAVAEQEAEPSKKKARRGSRHAEAISPSHYGPVVCTSAAALVQAYLATDTASTASGGAAQQSHGGGSSNAKGGTSTSRKSVQRPTSDGRRFLNMSESTLDLVKRRFGGKSKPVTLAAGAATGTAAGVSSSSGSSSKGARLSFGQGTKIVATNEAVHTALHRRCVFVLLRELCDSSGSKNGGTASSSSPVPDVESYKKSDRIDTAHLVTLSPDDLFCALSVESFSLTAVSTDAGATGTGGGGSRRGQQRQHQQVPAAAGTLPRAFEVVDGPAIIHRPAARQGEPWRGLEIFRSDGVAGPWRGRRIPVPVGGRRGGGDGGIDHDDGGIFGHGNSGSRGAVALRLDLAAASADNDFAGATPPLSQESVAAAARSKKRAAGFNGVLVCPPGASLSPSGRGSMLEENSGGCNETEAAVVALPACVVAAAAGEAECAPPPPPPSRPLQWTSLSMDGEGRASLSPWRGLPFESKNSLTCLCRAPGGDTGMVTLAAGGGGLVLRPTPPTVYVGMAGGGGRSGAGTATETEESGGVLLELQGGTLSGSRLLPAPPAAVMSAAVDDAQGLLAVLLADQAGTALLLARDGSDFPVVEQHRGITAAFTGDFLGNGREQVALLCSASSSGGGAGAGAGRGGKRGGVGGAKASAGGWEQAPLKALVKRALVTDGSFIWENQRREDPQAAPAGGGVNGRSGADTREAAAAGAGPRGNNGLSKGKKRQRSEESDHKDSGEGNGESANGSPAASVRPSKIKTTKDSQDDGHRLDRLSSVVGVLRRRVQAEEIRLLRLRQARQGKAAALEAAKLALAAHVDGVGFDAESEASAGHVGGNHFVAVDVPTSLTARAFTGGLVTPGDDISTTSSIGEAGEGASELPRPPPPPLLCTIARARFHAPSRALCLDAHIGNPSPGNSAGDAAGLSARPSATVFNVCLTVASASGNLTARSAVCPRLCPGESATVRACVDVPFDLLADSGGGGGAVKGAVSLFASCTWSLFEENVSAGRGRDGHAGALRVPCCSLMFSRILVSPQDMLGMGGALTSTALAPASKMGQDPSHRSTTPGGGRKKGAASNSSNGGGGVDKHLGIFDVGTPLDLLLRSDPATAASLAALPQAVRSLSEVAALPEPWAGGAAVRVKSCSERAAECTVRAGDATSAPAVILAVAAGALPDGARASADHASEQGRALVAAAAAALRDEMAALEAIARERGLLGAGAGAERGQTGGVGGGGKAAGGLEAALERYGAAQMKSDVLAARLAGRVVAAGGAARGRGRGGLV